MVTGTCTVFLAGARRAAWARLGATYSQTWRGGHSPTNRERTRKTTGRLRPEEDWCGLSQSDGFPAPTSRTDRDTRLRHTHDYRHGHGCRHGHGYRHTHGKRHAHGERDGTISPGALLEEQRRGRRHAHDGVAPVWVWGRGGLGAAHARRHCMHDTKLGRDRTLTCGASVNLGWIASGDRIFGKSATRCSGGVLGGSEFTLESAQDQSLVVISTQLHVTFANSVKFIHPKNYHFGSRLSKL